MCLSIEQVDRKDKVCQSEYCTTNLHADANDLFIKTKRKNQYLPASERMEPRDLKTVKERVANETTSVPKIYEEELARSNLSSAALTIRPLPIEATKLFSQFDFSKSLRSIESALNRVCRTTTLPIPKPSDFDIADFYHRTLNDTSFICTNRFIKNSRTSNSM